MTPHFTLDELIHSNTAGRLDIDNTPDEASLVNLKILAEGLELVREKLGSIPIRISSGYRCLKLNRALKSRDSSYHRIGLAADFSCPRFGTIKEVMDVLADSSIEFDKLIIEFNTWIHIAFPKEGEVARRYMYQIDKKGVSIYNG